MRKIAIIIQGSSSNVSEQLSVWNKLIKNVIFSTWKGEEDKYTEQIVIFNDIPSDPGPMNFNYQIKSTYNGLLKAKELGFTHALKLRSDLVPTNVDEFIKLIDNDSMNFLCWHRHQVYPNCPGYLIDYLMSGPIDDMIKLWDIKDIFCVVPEVILTKNYIDNFSIKNINYFLKDINDKNNLFWIKRNIFLDTYKVDLTDPFNKYSFSDDIEYLNTEYIKKFL